ncbi:MAG: hypothetical protein HOO91_00010 [Bacteroidales bacterium]|nr:hypothetical protein [Bacteroidales bacterium]
MKMYLLVLSVLFLLSCNSGVNKKSNESEGSQLNYNKSSVIQLKSKSVLNKKLVVQLPLGFTLMDFEMLKAKYPIEGHRPTEVYTNEEGTINIAFNHTSPLG